MSDCLFFVTIWDGDANLPERQYFGVAVDTAMSMLGAYHPDACVMLDEVLGDNPITSDVRLDVHAYESDDVFGSAEIVWGGRQTDTYRRFRYMRAGAPGTPFRWVRMPGDWHGSEVTTPEFQAAREWHSTAGDDA